MNELRQKKNESTTNYKERLRLSKLSDKVSNTMSYNEYIELLDNNNFDYIEITVTKKKNKKVRMCIPICNYNIYSNRRIYNLFQTFRRQ